MSTISPTKKAYLLLQDGTMMQGTSIGANGTAGGELCFNTGMTGYQEVFTDPSYTGQVLIMNTNYIGNYGVRSTDVESDKVTINAIICKNTTNRYSRPMADGDLGAYLLANNVVAISDIDTRALVAHVRTKGAMNCIVSTELDQVSSLQAALQKVPDMSGLDLSSMVSTKEAYTVGEAQDTLRIAVLDFGVKRHILTSLAERGAYLKVFPAHTSMQEMEAFQPHGYFISNGPGDPGAMDYAVATVKEIIAAHKPLFGICLGHQLLARANDIPTFKMHHGHRGLNHPVKNLLTGKSEITTQNHGFGIDPEVTKQKNNLTISHINLNDHSIEGIKMLDRPAFSVQYHPESTPGPHDSRYLFDDFIAMIKNNH